MATDGDISVPTLSLLKDIVQGNPILDVNYLLDVNGC